MPRFASPEEKRTFMLTTPIPRLIPNMALPSIAGMLVTSAYNLADTFFVGQIGAPNQLAALKIPCCDSELIEKIAIETGFAK